MKLIFRFKGNFNRGGVRSGDLHEVLSIISSTSANLAKSKVDEHFWSIVSVFAIGKDAFLNLSESTDPVRFALEGDLPADRHSHQLLLRVNHWF